MSRACGSCNLCCKAIVIGELDKPAGAWCRHAVKGAGCGIYVDRFPVCRAFECLWLQRDHDGIPEAFKPDRVHAVLAGEDDKLIVHVDPGYPTAHRTGRFGEWLLGLDKSLRVVAIVGEAVFARLGKQWVRCTVEHRSAGNINAKPITP